MLERYELSSDFQSGYIYSSNSCIAPPFLFKIQKQEKLFNIYATKVRLLQNFIMSKNLKDIVQILKEVKCPKCHEIIIFKSYNPLPTSNWKSLIDFWSCHKSEFKTMLDLPVQPRPMGVLYGNFYMMTNQKQFCCLKYNTQVLCYNDIVDSKTFENFIFLFFSAYFKDEDRFYFGTKTNNKEIKLELKIFEHNLFCLKNSTVHPALKVGLRSVETSEFTDKLLPYSVMNEIYEYLKKYSLEINILGYDLSLISFE